MNANKKTLVIAHRGDSGAAPENTLAAIQRAIEIGVDMIEIDVHLTKDGIPVVIHDDTINRTSDGKGRVRELTFEQLQKFDSGAWFSEKYKGEKIPSLQQVLSLIYGKCGLLIEVKHGSGKYPGIEKRVLDLIIKNNAQSWCIMQSFNSEVLSILSKLGSSIEMHKLVTGDIPLLPLHVDYKLRKGRIYQYRNASGINPNHRFVNKKVVEKIHSLNKKIFTWTVNDDSVMKKMIAAGVDGIITNYPSKLKALLS